MADQPELKLIIEAALMAADEPLSINRIRQLFDEECLPEKQAIKEALEALIQDYAERGMECIELASGYTFRVKKDFSPWVAKLWDLKPVKYTRAFLETLALIAYKQPITRSEIEQVRGVAVSSHIIKSLLEREWIKVVGHRDVPGKPAVLATTKNFLDYFNLQSLAELPPLVDIVDLEKVGTQLEMQLTQAMGEDSSEVQATPESVNESEIEIEIDPDVEPRSEATELTSSSTCEESESS